MKIEKLKKYVKGVAFDFEGKDCELFSDTKTDAHYTIVVMIPGEIASNMMDFQQELIETDPSLVCGPSDLYHMTLMWLPKDKNIADIENYLVKILKNIKLSFSLNTLFLTGKGIGVAAYPSNNNLLEFRAKMSKRFNIPFAHSDLEQFSWITLARYSRKPNQELLGYLRSKFDSDFGDFKVKRVDVFENEDKNLVGAKKLFSISM